MTHEELERIAALTRELENLKRSLPAHSLKPAMLIRIEELEEEIELLKRETSQQDSDDTKEDRTVNPVRHVWAVEGSNLRPHGCQPCALTN